jgi:hypothetical protein
MIHRATIAVCLLLISAILAIAVASWHSEFVLSGENVWVYKRQIGAASPTYSEICTQLGTRISFSQGTLCYAWSYCPWATVTHRPDGTYLITPPPPISDARRDFTLFEWKRNVRRLGRQWMQAVPPPPSTAVSQQVTVPLWPPLVLLTAYPILAAIRGPYRRHRRRKKGLCLKCGYDLTGNVSGVCPECGDQI